VNRGLKFGKGEVEAERWKLKGFRQNLEFLLKICMVLNA
jgi:hypothetical protein